MGVIPLNPIQTKSFETRIDEVEAHMIDLETDYNNSKADFSPYDDRLTIAEENSETALNNSSEALALVDDNNSRLINLFNTPIGKDLELQDIRFDDINNIQYDSAGDRINKINSDLNEKAKQVDVNNALGLKRDKTTLITMNDVALDVKTAMTGGSVAVVGRNAVTDDSLGIGAVKSAKIKDLADMEVLKYNGADQNNTLHGGASNTIYIINQKWNNTERPYLTHIRLGVFADCTLNLYVFTAITGGIKVEAIIPISAKAGTFDYSIDYKLPDGDVYIGFDGKSNTILYSVDTPNQTKYANLAQTLTVGQQITITMSSQVGTANFAINVYFGNTLNTYIDKINKNATDIAQINSISLKGKTILLIGDSRMSTDYTWAKDLLAQKTGATVLNQGWSGATPAQLASDTYLNNILNIDHDICIFMGVANTDGFLGWLGTFSNTSEAYAKGEALVSRPDTTQPFNPTTYDHTIQALDYIVRKWKAKYYDFRTQSNKRRKFIFLTDLPMQHSQSAMASSPASWSRKSRCVKEVADTNAVQYIDTMQKCDFDMSYEPFFTSPTDMVNNHGLYYMDGLHPNQYGWDILTDIIKKEI